MSAAVDPDQAPLGSGRSDGRGSAPHPNSGLSRRTMGSHLQLLTH